MTLPDAAGERPPISPEGLAALFGVPFTDEQLAAITAPHHPSVVIAGAGSGKTTVMSARVVWLVAGGQVRPDAVLGLTFTNKAATELSTRVRGALRRLETSAQLDGLLDAGEPTISTYHAYAGALLREYGVWAGYEPTSQLLTDAQRFQLAESVVRRAPGPFPALGVQLKAVTERVIALDGEVNEHLVDLDDLEAHDRALIDELDAVERAEGKLSGDPSKARDVARARLELTGLVRSYRLAKQRRDVVDFGDQMARAAVVAEAVPQVARGERERFATVLLDEYQDTSMAQQRLLLALFGDGHPVTAVGDPFQSIYGWRGAAIKNILSFRHDFGGTAAAPLFTLGQNNRSGGRILTAANAIAEPLRADLPDVAVLRARPGEHESGHIWVGMYRTAAEEATAVCDAIAAEVSAGRPPREIAVLCREVKSFPALVAGLTERKVPVDVVGVAGLLEVPEVVDVVAVLEVLSDPTANPQMVRILAGPRWRIGPVDLAHLGARARALTSPAGGFDAPLETSRSLGDELLRAVAGSDPAETVSLLEAVGDPGPLPYSAEARERFAALSAELDGLRQVLTHPPDTAIAEVIRSLGIDVELAVAGRPGDHLDALLEQARLFTASGGGTTVGPFLTYLRLAERYGETLAAAGPIGGDGVSLLTVHKAKGLEWHSVYVPAMVAGVFPSTRGRSTPYSSAAVLPYALRGDADDFPTVATWSGNQGVKHFKDQVSARERAEDRRLAYVAVTRAARRLVVTGHWWGPSQQKPRQLSPYLQTLTELGDTAPADILHWAAAPDDSESNPALDQVVEHPWPITADAERAAHRRAAADLVRGQLGAEPASVESRLSEVDRLRVARWDRDLDALRREVAGTGRTNGRPIDLVSATTAVSLVRDPVTARRLLDRPQPRPPAEAARRGTRFHEWVQARFGQVPLLDIDGSFDDPDEPDERALQELQDAFLSGPYAQRSPLAVETPFQLMLGDTTVAGRIDAVYRTHEPPGSDLPPDTQYEVVDWKTGTQQADQLQLAIYRLAWAELHAVPVDAVAATFYYVATAEVVRPTGLPDRVQLEALWAGADLG